MTRWTWWTSIGKNVRFFNDVQHGGRETATSSHVSLFNRSETLSEAVLFCDTPIWPDAFLADCTNLSEVVLMPGVVSIGKAMFKNCPSIAAITIPETVTNVMAEAFAWTGWESVPYDNPTVRFEPSRLATVKIPASVQTIGANAFAGCNAMDTLYIEEDSPISDATLRNDCKLVSTCRIVRGDLPPDDLQIVTEFLPPATEDFYYWSEVRIAGGEEPFSWSLEAAPDGVEIGDDGVLWGNPEGIGTHKFAVIVTDAAGRTARRTLSLVVHADENEVPEILSWTPEASRFRLDPGATTNLSVVACDPDGDELAYSWSVYDEDWNRLENGASTSASFAFSRAVGKEGTNIVEVFVFDGLHSVFHSWTILVQEKTPLAIVTDATLPVALTDSYYNQPIKISGGEWPYTWELVDPENAPACLYVWDENYNDGPGFSSDWWPSEDDIGTYSFSLRVTDAEGSNVVKTFTLEVRDNPNPPPVIDETSPAYNVHVEPGTSQTFSVEAHDRKGDALSYSWWRDGEEAPGATGSSWTLEATDADMGSF